MRDARALSLLKVLIELGDTEAKARRRIGESQSFVMNVYGGAAVTYTSWLPWNAAR